MVTVAACAATALPLTAHAASAPPLRNVIADPMAPPLPTWTQAGRPRLRPAKLRDGRGLTLSGPGSIRHTLPPRPWSVSLDFRVFQGATLEIAAGGNPLQIEHTDDGTLTITSGDQSATLPGPAGGWHHLEIAGFAPAELQVDGNRIPNGISPATAVRIRTTAGSAQLTGLVATRRDDARAALLHRLAELHARTQPRRFPIGVGADDGILRFGAGWTDGFWSGSLWRAFDLTKAPLFREWARIATLDHFGREDDPIHDQGFRYLESSAAAFDRLCDPHRDPQTQPCRVLLKSTSKAARTLVELAAGNQGTGALPTVAPPEKCRECASDQEAETIVDSIMNAGLLDWEWRRSRVEVERTVALNHARAVARLLVRGDGSTAQGVRTNRADGTVLGYTHRQGLSAESTWARGQAWAIYGFARTGRAFRQPDLIATSERAAVYLAGHLPSTGVPLYDFDAPPGSPEDTSAGVIAAAGLFRLADACERNRGACDQPSRWRPLARRMLAHALEHVDRHAPVGVLGDQVYSLGGSATWDDRGEFMFGLAYALEAIDAGLSAD